MAQHGLHSLQQAIEGIKAALPSNLNEEKAGTIAAAPACTLPPASLPSYQAQVIDAFLRSPGNEVAFLPTGMGQNTVADAITRGMLERFPKKHVVVCVVRPAQALSQAERLRAVLDVPVAAFCGGDFLYDFPAEFARNRVLVFTAGLLMRLAKLGTYHLDSASLLVLHDAFSSVRNHPMNTLVREYYWKLEEEKGREGDGKHGEVDKPRILGLVLPQLQNLQRPFDKLRQLVRKLCHNAQAGVLLPTGPALEALAMRTHHAHLALHGYELSSEEEEVLEALQAHCLLVWDTLHDFGLNHFGRLIHFPPSVGQPATHQSSPAGTGGRGGQQHRDGHQGQVAGGQRGGGATIGMRPMDDAAIAFNPAHHDWRQIELMVQHSIAVTEALPKDNAEHPHSAAALAVMHHVLLLCHAVRRGLELGTGAALAAVLPALQSLAEFLKQESASTEDIGTVDTRLAARVLDVLPTSPLFEWIAKRGAQGLASKFGAKEGEPRLLTTRMKELVSVLHEIEEHATDGGLVPVSAAIRVALIVGDEVSAEAVQHAVRDVGDIDASIAPWSSASNGAGGTGAAPKSFSAVAAAAPDSAVASPRALSVEVMTVAEAMTAPGWHTLSTADEVVWFSASDVMHAAGFDYDSLALSTACAVSAAGDAPGPTCHIIATEAQAAAWMEVSKADQLLLAAMQLVQAGDASFEEYLSQLIVNGTAPHMESFAVPPAAEILHTLCLGLCGQPPQFDLSRAENHFQAAVRLPEDMVDLSNTSPSFGRPNLEPLFWGQPAASEAEARDSAAEIALAAVGSLGFAAAYWQTRQLLMLHSRHVAAAAAVAASMPAVSLRQVTVANPAVPTMPPSPFFEGSAVPDTGGELLPSPYATPTERLICSVCGIVTTSEAHLAEHMAGRRHQKNLERLQLQGRAQAPADRASSTSEASEEDLKAKHSAASDGPDTKRPPLGPSGALPLVSMSTIDRLPSTLSDIFIRRSSSFRRHSSGNVYEGFPCVRVGDMVLPSSMDLRAFLEEMQTLELLDANTPEPMPTIKEKGGRQGGGGSGSSGGGGGAGRSREGPQGGSRSRPPSGRFTQGAALRAGLHADVGHPMAIPPPPHGHYAPRPQQPLGRSPQRGPVRQRFASFGGCGPGSSPGGGTALGYAPGMYAAPAPGMVGHGYAPVGMGYVPFMQPDVAQQQQQQAYIQAYQAGMHPGMMVAGLPQAPVGAHQGYYGAGHALQQQHDHRTPPRN